MDNCIFCKIVAKQIPASVVYEDDDVLAFDRGPTFRCVVNLSARPVDLAGQGRVLLASGPCPGELPPDTAVWLSSPGEG